MSDPDLTHDTDEQTDESPVIKELREKANRTKEAEARAAAAERELAFDRAGVPIDGPAKWFRQGYDGEITPEAIRAAAEADGLITPAAPEVDPQEAKDAGQISAAMAGGEPPAPTDLNDKLREAGKDGYGDPAALDAAIADLALTSEDFDRIARHPYVA